jgi:site-specific DNA recombinase
MKEVAINTRFSVDAGLDADSQREELIAKLGKEYEIVGEYRDVASGTQESQDRPGLKKLLEDAAKGDFEVLLCSDLTRLTRGLSPEFIGAIQKAGVKIVTTDGTEISSADLVAHMTINPIRRTFVEAQSQRIKRGIGAAKLGVTRKRQPPKK